jgi:ribosomal protein S18 acetylase RimI-like enzyme
MKIVRARKKDYADVVEILTESLASSYNNAFLGKTQNLRSFLMEQMEGEFVFLATNEADSVLAVIKLSHPKEKSVGLLKKAKLVFKYFPLFAALHSIFVTFIPSHPVKNALHISQIAVRKGNRDSGIGGKLLDFVFDLARELGYTKVTLMVNSENPALRLYEMHGFYVTKRYKSWIVNEALGYKVALFMTKDL